MRVLIADDENELAEAVGAALKREHFSVDIVHDGGEAWDYAVSGSYDCLVLDVAMPVMDGLAVLGGLRGMGISTPVLLVSSHAQAADRVLGLNSGADDYLSKPYDLTELVARVRAVSRRRERYMPSILSIGNVSLNCDSFELTGPKGTVRLGNKEFQMMELMMRRQGRFISTEEFMERVWGYETDSEINVVWAYVSYLRRRLKSIGGDVRISVSRGRGYMLEPLSVSETFRQDAPSGET